MKAFWSIVKLTFKNALRSHIFQLLLVVLILCVALIPNTITGDGTAQGYIQISLKYSLAAIAFVLSLSSIWLGCHILGRDIENYQIHMVVSKPVSRVAIWLAKWTGINLIHLLLLLVAAGSIYGTILYQFYQQPFNAAERKKIENEVLVGRRVFMPKLPDIEKIAREVLKYKIKQLGKQGKSVDTSAPGQEKMLKDIRRSIIAQMAEIQPGAQRGWEYEGLPVDSTRPLFLRYRFYVNKVSTDQQRLTRGLWMVGVPKVIKKKAKNVFEQAKAEEVKIYMYPLSQMPEQIMTGVFHEKDLLGNIITPEGKAFLTFTNLDPKRSALFAQVADGPKVLLQVSGFLQNYCRAIIVIFLQLIILSGLACAAAAVLSMPTAIFLVISYLLFGSFASFMVSTTYFSGVADHIGYFVGKLLLLGVIPMQAFEVTHFVANGELIEFVLIGKLFAYYFLLRALPLFLLGIWLYWRKELGLVIRK